ncbi:DUF5615 family PIN-like protein [Candidatus Poriferisodalis sp.]|uniref:DUF5615 family PIN-like protein n=1 Tax=Candidatus Poriferisodalis sp. TaxID=3101277 RepID=UPI003AF9D7E2
MRILLDANLSPRVAGALRAGGHETLHVGDVDMLTAADETILEWAAEHGYVVATSDSDFGALLFRRRSVSPSVIHLRGVSHQSPDAHAALLVESLPVLAEALEAGAVVSLSPTRIRVRDLPIW